MHFKYTTALRSALSAVFMFGAVQAHAATVILDFDTPMPADFTLIDSSPFVGPGNCIAGNCIKINKNGLDTLSIDPPKTFSISSFWFQLLGNRDEMVVTTNLGVINLLESVFDHNTGHHADGMTLSVADFAKLQNITFISFIMGTNGNGRVDDIVVDYDVPAPVPVPAAGLMLLGGLAGLAGLRRRKTAA